MTDASRKTHLVPKSVADEITKELIAAARDATASGCPCDTCERLRAAVRAFVEATAPEDVGVTPA